MTNQQTDVRTLRRAPRRKLFQPVEVRTAQGSQRAHLLDLSAHGGQLHMGAVPDLGTALTLLCNGLTRTARVAWVQAPRIGITFTLPLTSDQLDALLASGADPVPLKMPLR